MDHLSPLSFAVHSTFGFVSIAILVGLYRVILHPLRGIPGPFLAKFTELWRTRRYFSGYWHEDILNLHKKYGPVVRIAPNEVSVVHLDLTTTAYGYGSAGTTKTSWYNTWAALGGSSGKKGPPSVSLHLIALLPAHQQETVFRGTKSRDARIHEETGLSSLQHVQHRGCARQNTRRP